MGEVNEGKVVLKEEKILTGRNGNGVAIVKETWKKEGDRGKGRVLLGPLGVKRTKRQEIGEKGWKREGIK